MRSLTPDTSKEAQGVRITAIRETRGITQAALADLLGVSSQRYGQYEIGRSQMPADIIGKLWQITGATADYILMGRMEGLPHELAQKLVAAERRAREANSR